MDGSWILDPGYWILDWFSVADSTWKPCSQKKKPSNNKKNQQKTSEKKDEKDKDETGRPLKQSKKVISISMIKSRLAPKLGWKVPGVYLVIAGIVKHRKKSLEITHHL
ncbi:GL14659 [Drosophila persimilis]|uniref:GL14659 n=1 Tax=Drosophila persimilis TaxID=7234 RepID=B4GVK4_DROPE|nr:GL14659 [Drosophila persimilis]